MSKNKYISNLLEVVIRDNNTKIFEFCSYNNKNN